MICNIKKIRSKMFIIVGMATALLLTVPLYAVDQIDVGDSSAPFVVDIIDNINDNNLELFIGNSSGTILYYEQSGSDDDGTPQYNENPGFNPLGGEDVGDNSVPTFIDIDNDDDFDAFIGNSSGTILYYENTGLDTNPDLDSRTGNANPLIGIDVGDDSAPTFVDIDSDGDFDAFIGNNSGTILYYENTGDVATSDFSDQTNAVNPLSTFDVGENSAPAFIDIDGDGDFDAFVGELTGVINYYENTDPSDNKDDPTFVERVGTLNPFNGEDVGLNSIPCIVDIYNDGDVDAFIGDSAGQITYSKNVGIDYLTIKRSGSGGGSVESDPDGIDCGSDCEETYIEIDEEITLTASPDNDSDFEGWSGDCSGSGSEITITISGDMNCTAEFSDDSCFISVASQ